MPVREFNRQQTWLFPPTLDELIPDDHPVRFVASVVDTVDDAVWRAMHIAPNGEALGAPAYHPRALLGVWLFGFMNGTRSSRKLEAACRDQMPYLWLTGWQHPDHNTLWRFYKDHRAEMRHLFKLTVRTAVKMDLVDLAVQAVDGTKIVANAAKERTYDAAGLERLLQRTETAIQELEKENEANADPAPAHLPEKLRHVQLLRAEVKDAMRRVSEEEGRKRVNLTDNDADFVRTRHGIVAGYNMQAVVSPLKIEEGGKPGLLITAVETVQDPADTDQLMNMLAQAEDVTGQKADITVADAGYHSGSNLAMCEQRRQAVAMPESQDKRLQNPYHKDKFQHDVRTDTYLCPGGQTLHYVETRSITKKKVRVYGGLGTVCRHCVAFGWCTKSYYRGRELLIGPYDTVLRKHREWMKTDEARKAYRQRKTLVEPSFGIVKEQMGMRRFLLRGLAEVRAEAKMLALAFNLRTLCRLWQTWKHEKRAELDAILWNLTHDTKNEPYFYLSSSSCFRHSSY
jgi:transposase